jgi:hypothetical protein
MALATAAAADAEGFSGHCGGCARRMKLFADRSRATVLLAAALLVPVSLIAKIEPLYLLSLRMATVRAFDAYIARTSATNASSLASGHFLWTDDLDENQRTAAYANLRSGAVEVRRVSDSSGAGTDAPGGMIHAWKGIVFIPGAKLDDVLKVLQDYDRHATYYAPDVAQSKIESRDGNHFRVFMRFRREKIVTVVLDTEQDINYYRDSPTRAHSRSSATRIAQVDNPGSAQERERTPGEDSGFLWRMETWWRMEERDGGVYVQNEVVTLTRDIPFGLAWMVEPFITKIPRESLEFTLKATRKAVLASKSQ